MQGLYLKDEELDACGVLGNVAATCDTKALPPSKDEELEACGVLGNVAATCDAKALPPSKCLARS